ncbi:hypothetical protein CIPAW_03G114500 [Carya illinoinensis]|uniref:Uncharacterized protein n=1 Tax=Carya illinoinensis TaxID=32201 RepID=A0A8T1QZK6_CARIL|nr:hypothetical protein CIPAW_03G114500 [Carya illinoinensis]
MAIHMQCGRWQYPAKPLLQANKLLQPNLSAGKPMKQGSVEKNVMSHDYYESSLLFLFHLLIFLLQ